MIDIHSHILPGLDDGSKSFEQSLAMVQMAAAAGTSDIVASPHANPEFKFDADIVEQLIRELQVAAGDSPRIHYGCDFHLSFDNIQDAVAHPGKYTINHKGYLLVEFSDLTIFPTTTGIFEQLMGSGMVPVITHPERNSLLQQRLPQLTEWVRMGCLIQVTAQSFLGRFGNRARQFSEVLMKHHLVHVIASDAHDLQYRPPVMDEARAHLAKRYGETVAQRLAVDNPRAVIHGEPLDDFNEGDAAPARKWYQFWA